MQEILAQLLEYFWGLWRFKWYGLLVAWIAAMGGWIWVNQMPEAYVATARIHVDSNSVLRPLLRGLAIQPDVNQRITLLSQTLLSRPNLEKLMHMSDLDLQVRTDLRREQVMTDLRNTISIRGERRNESLYTVSYKHRERDTAKRVVQSLITIFIESTLGDKRKDSSDAQEFLDEQIAEYEARLAEAEKRLADFKQRHVGSLPGDQGSYYQRLEAERSQLSAARLELNEAENRRDELQRQLAGEEPIFLGMDEMRIDSSLDGRIDLMKTKLDELSLKYTNKHPEIIDIRRMIANLEAERKREINEYMAMQMETHQGLENNPVYQQMRSMLAETEARAAELRARVTEYEKRVDELGQKVDNIPVIEAELQQLDRDYAVISQQHNTLLQRREAARISEKAEQSVDDLKMRVVDPPFVPLEPTEPNKFLLNALVFLGALGAGLGLALVLSLLRPVFANRRTLGQVSGLPVLGSVTFIASPSQKRRAFAAGVLFSSLAALLFITFGGVILSVDSGIDVAARLAQVRARLL